MNQTCPHCSSTDTTWKAKAGKWECNACEERFDGPAPDSTASPSPISSPIDPIPDSPSPKAPSLSDKAAVPKKIFFSYGHDHNQELVDSFKNDLKARGYDVWQDIDRIGPWTDWREEIAKGIRGSGMAVAFLSIHSTREPGVCRNEIAMALHHFGRVFPVLLEDQSRITLPAAISILQWNDLSEWRELKERNPADFERWYGQKLEEIIRCISEDEMKAAGEIGILRRVLAPCSFDSIFAQHLEGFVGREWLFEEFGKWLEHQPDSRVFWLKAGPGFGKTAWAVNLANQRRDAVLCTWFCNSQSVELRDPLRAVMTLAFQMAIRLGDFRENLLHRLGLSNGSDELQIAEVIKDLAKKNLDDLFTHLIAEPLALLTWKRDHKLVILMDALDEATDSDRRNPLTALISGRFLELPKWISFVVTSRPEDPVEGHLQGFKPFNLSAEDGRNTGDLDRYCRKEIVGLKLLESLSSEERDKLCSRLVEKAGGMILYLRMVVEGLNEGTLQPSDLDSMQGGLTGLHARYNKTFSIRFSDNYRKELAPLLSLILSAKSPLPPVIAREVLRMTKPELEARILRLGSYLEADGGGYRFFHKSLRDWLADEMHPFSLDYEEGLKAFGEFFSQSTDLHLGNRNLRGDDSSQLYIRKHGLHHLMDRGLHAEASQHLRDPSYLACKISSGEGGDLLQQFERIISELTPAPTSSSLVEGSSFPLWSLERIASENRRMAIAPTEADVMDQFLNFVSSELLGDSVDDSVDESDKDVRRRETKTPVCDPVFVATMATNSQPRGVLRDAGLGFLKGVRTPYLERRWEINAPGSTRSPLMADCSSAFRIDALALASEVRLSAVAGEGGKILVRKFAGDTGISISTGARSIISLKLSSKGDNLLALSKDGRVFLGGHSSSHGFQMNGDFSILKGPVGTLEEVRIHTESLRSMDACFRRKILVSGCNGGRVSAWGLDGSLLWSRRDFDGGKVTSIAICEERDMLVATGESGLLEIMVLSTGEVVKTLADPIRKFYSVTIDAVGSRVVVGCDTGTAFLWNPETKQSIPLEGHRGRVVATATTPSGDRFVTGGRDDRTIRVWSTEGECLRVLEGHNRDVTSVAISQDGLRVYSGGWDTRELVWDIERAGAPRTDESRHGLNVPCIVHSPCGSWAYSGSWDRTVRKWEVATASLIAVWEVHAGTVNALSLDKSGERLLSTGGDGEILLRETSGGGILRRIKVSKKLVRSVNFSPCGRYAVATGQDRLIKIWDLESGELVRTLPDGEQVECHSDDVTNALFTPDGARIVSSSHDGDLRIWEAVSGSCSKVLAGHTREVRNLVLSPDGKRAYSGSWDRSIRGWELSSGRKFLHIAGAHDLAIRALEIGENGQYLFSGSWDRTVKVWDAYDGRLVTCLGVEGAESLSYHDGSGVLAIGSNLGEVVFYDVCNLS